MASNVHCIPKKQWAKWNQFEQAWFNRLWRTLSPNTLRALGIPKLTQCRLKVLRWNLCWLATDTIKDWLKEEF